MGGEMNHFKHHWRAVLAGLPLPMLALAASYGVYSFALLFVPQWVAIVQAAAFEATYVGLAVLMGLDTAQRRRAGAISVGAVVVSILYNSLAGLFHRRPELLDAMPWWADGILAAMHGAPLALVAYFVADLLLHREEGAVAMPALSYARIPEQPVYPAPVLVASKALAKATKLLVCPGCSATLDTPGEYGAARRWGKCKHCR
jgi:hypothetical protein